MQQLLAGIVKVCVMHRTVTEQNPLFYTDTPKKPKRDRHIFVSVASGSEVQMSPSPNDGRAAALEL